MKEEKRCGKCGEIKEVSEFHRANNTENGFQNRCKTCTRARGKAVYSDPEYYVKRKEWRRKNRFAYSLTASRNMAKLRGYQPCNATKEEIEAVFTGRCDICGVPEAECTKKLSLDHCHESGDLRGWLCQCCNATIGMLKNSREIALNAVLYIQRHETQEQIVKE